MGEFSVTRTHATWKPRVIDTPIPYYRCSCCGAILSGIDGNCEIDWKKNPNDEGAKLYAKERTKIFNPPYAQIDFKPECCGQPMEKLEAVPHIEIMDKIKLDYQIVGGMNNNALNVTWNIKNPACKPRWFTLKTFTGSMTKYVTPQKWPPIVFAFADEDAFAYCDKNPCVECTFRCKRGMEIYAYIETIGLVIMPLERMVPPGSGNTSFESIAPPIP